MQVMEAPTSLIGLGGSSGASRGNGAGGLPETGGHGQAAGGHKHSVQGECPAGAGTPEERVTP